MKYTCVKHDEGIHGINCKAKKPVATKKPYVAGVPTQPDIQCRGCGRVTKEQYCVLCDQSPAHTPTPWSYIVSANGGKLCHVETDMANPHGAGIPVCSIPVKREADAAFIVKAANSYQDRLSFLYVCKGFFQALHTDGHQGAGQMLKSVEELLKSEEL